MLRVADGAPMTTVELLNLQDAINDVLLLIDQAWEVASMMHLASSIADIDPAMAASALTSILELAQARGSVAKEAAEAIHARALKRYAKKSRR
jgi:hypothetical protein